MSADIYIANSKVASASLEQAYILIQSLESQYKIQKVLTFFNKHHIYLH